MEILNIEARSKQDALPVAKVLFEKLKKYETIGLYTTVQHLDELATVRNYFNLKGKKVVIGGPGPRCKYAGQVLGCDVAGPLAFGGVDAYVFLGTGRFHPLALAAQTDKPVFTANPFLNHVEKIAETEIRRMQAKIAANVAKVMSAKIIGILVTVKPGQNQLKLAIKLRKKLEGMDKTVFVFMGDTIAPDQMCNFSKVEAWINTCCPRMAEDVSSFGRPVANWFDLDINI